MSSAATPTLAVRRSRKRLDLLAATEAGLRQPPEPSHSKPVRCAVPSKIGIAVGAVLDKHKMAKHFT